MFFTHQVGPVLNIKAIKNLKNLNSQKETDFLIQEIDVRMCY